MLFPAQFIIVLFVSAIASVSYADSTAILVHQPTIMEHNSEADSSSSQCYVLRSRTIYAHANELPEATGENTISSPACAKGYAPVGAYGSVAGGATYKVLAADYSYAFHSAGTSFGVRCCPLKTTWRKVGQEPDRPIGVANGDKSTRSDTSPGCNGHSHH